MHQKKAWVVYLGVFTLLFFIALNVHGFVLEHAGKNLSFPLGRVYLFHYAFSLGVCILFNALYSVQKFRDQLGFLYLGAVFLKLFAFVLIFEHFLFSDAPSSTWERISYLVPLFLFLFSEAYFIIKILNRKQLHK